MRAYPLIVGYLPKTGEVNSQSDALTLQKDLDLVVSWSKITISFMYIINSTQVQWVNNYK